MKAPLIQHGEALMLSLIVATQQEIAAANALNQTETERNARLDEMMSAKVSVSKAEEAIRQFAAKTQVMAVYLSSDREGFYEGALKSGVMPGIAPPALGEYWPAQGGINGGHVAARGDVLEHYLIIAAKDVGTREWGGRGNDLTGTSKTDGYLNTQLLCNDEAEHPAANACAEYQADGHHDFYLPACAELYQCWVSVPDLFSTDNWYWSSSQRSADFAFTMYFGVGTQLYYGKNNELLVRPVRRKFI